LTPFQVYNEAVLGSKTDVFGGKMNGLKRSSRMPTISLTGQAGQLRVSLQEGLPVNMVKQKKKLSPAPKAAKKERRKKYMTILLTVSKSE
jgi:hypothetical protein